MNATHEGALIFMTDPICSWCWGTLPEILKARDALGERLEFRIACAGLQVGAQKPLKEPHRSHLLRLWQDVAATTGQEFAYEFPEDAAFIYHSELACRALMLARRQLQDEPWDLFYRMQRAFYVNAINLGDLDALYELSRDTGITESAFMDAMTGDAIVDATRQEFEWCKDRAISALPTVFLDLGSGPELVCGGYVTADFLVPDLTARLTTH